jgi:hypothetical protein
MHDYSLSVSLTLALALAAMAIPARTAAAAEPAQAQQARRVWSNDDLDELRARGLISIVPAEEAPAAPPGATPPAQPAPVYASRMQDPAWYSDQAAELQAQLNANMTALLEARAGLAQARSLRQTTGGINLAQGSTGNTPEEGIAILEARVGQVQSRLEELADLARRNYIPPGLLRPLAA